MKGVKPNLILLTFLISMPWIVFSMGDVIFKEHLKYISPEFKKKSNQIKLTSASSKPLDRQLRTNFNKKSKPYRF